MSPDEPDDVGAAPAVREDVLADLDEVLELARDVSRAAGDLIQAGRRRGVDVASTKSSPVDVVTELDTASERLIRDAIRAARPQDGILGEEYGHEVGSSGLTWVVDPIDGTVNFLYGIPAYAVSIAAVAGDPNDPASWSVLAGSVHAPALRRTFWAAQGRGAWRADDGSAASRIAVRDPVPLSEALVATGFGYRRERRERQGRVVAALLPQVRDIRRAGAASLDLCSVACGELDAFYERGLKTWDLAAGEVIVREARGVVTGLRGRPAGEGMTLAGAPGAVAKLAAVLEQLRADEDDSPH